MGEFPYLDQLSRREHVMEHDHVCIDHMLSSGGFMVGGHIGNWELSAMPFISRDIPFSIIYRPLNNPLAKHALNKRLTLARKTYIKGMESARGIIETARKKDIMILLADQKLREGMIVPFFGKGATTPVSYIRAALKHDVPIIMVRVKRRKGCQFFSISNLLIRHQSLPQIRIKTPCWLSQLPLISVWNNGSEKPRSSGSGRIVGGLKVKMKPLMI